jgi:hypothetical protein
VIAEALAESEFAVIPEASLPACPKISKLFIAYLKGIVSIFSHQRAGGTADPRAAGFTEEVSAAAFVRLNAFKNAEHMAYVKHTLGKWERLKWDKPSCTEG